MLAKNQKYVCVFKEHFKLFLTHIFFLVSFIRFCTLDECRDAVAMLHGRLLGNRTITVEFACETKERLGTDDPDDFPVDSMYLYYV